MASKQPHQINCSFFLSDEKEMMKDLGKKGLIEAFRLMSLIRNFEVRAESAYQQGKIGGFFHSYIGQEAIQTAAVLAMTKDNWWVTTYRCHALALLLGASPNELMSELYGRANGNAKGRGGSMHFYTDRMLGGFGIVGGHLPIATGAAFSLKYQDNHKEAAVCFLGDGAVAQGAFHESLNMASLWNLPCIYVIENNKWGMGTSVEEAVAAKKLAEEIAPAYRMKAYTFDGMDFFNCYAGFLHAHQEVLKTGRPVLIEVVAERFKGHSISDPGLYRNKDDLKKHMEKDPIRSFQDKLIKESIATEEECKNIDKRQKEIVLTAMEHADSSPWPDPVFLEEDVFAP